MSKNVMYLSGYAAARDGDLGIDVPEDIASRGVEAEESYWDGFVNYLDESREFDRESRRLAIFAAVFGYGMIFTYIIIGIVKVIR